MVNISEQLPEIIKTKGNNYKTGNCNIELAIAAGSVVTKNIICK